jgi:hypothetical protein
VEEVDADDADDGVDTAVALDETDADVDVDAGDETDLVRSLFWSTVVVAAADDGGATTCFSSLFPFFVVSFGLKNDVIILLFVVVAVLDN